MGRLYEVSLSLGLVVCAATVALASEFMIVANKGVGTSSLSKSELQSIFLGEKTRWEDGKPIKIVILDEGSAHKAFLQSVVGKTPSQYESYWKKLVFTGKAASPKSFDDPSKLVDFVAGQSGAVGYVAGGQAGGSVKTISIR